MGAVQKQLFSKAEIQQENPVLDEYGRDRNSPAELWRAESNYEEGLGFVKFYTGYAVDLARLISGVEWPIVLFALGDTLGSPRQFQKRKKKPEEWTREITDEYLADLCGGCSPRHIERAVSALTRRDSGAKGYILAIKETGKGRYQLKPLCESWRGLVPAEKLPPQSAADQATVEEETDPDPVSKEAVPLIKKPAPVAKGKASRQVSITTGVRTFQIENRTGSDLVYDVVADRGRLAVVAASSLADLQDWRDGISSPSGISKLEMPSRHLCRGGEETPPAESNGHAAVPANGNGHSKNGRSNGVNGLEKSPRHLCRDEAPAAPIPFLDAELRTGLQRLGFRLTPSLLSKFPEFPEGCPASFIVAQVQERAARGVRKHDPLTDTKLLLFLKQDVPERWAAEQENQRLTRQTELPTGRKRDEAIARWRAVLSDPNQDFVHDDARQALCDLGVRP